MPWGGFAGPAAAAQEPKGTAGASFGGLVTWEFFGSTLKLQFLFIEHSGKRKVFQTQVCKHDLEEHL